MKRVLIKNAKELVCVNGFEKKSGQAMQDINVLKNASVYIEDGIIKEIGSIDESSISEDTQLIDASNFVVLPGFVDPHTHFVFGGYRDDEFLMRLQGAGYMEIMNAGGGIAATTNATKTMSFEELYDVSKTRLDAAIRQGFTTVEGKSGYGLDDSTELKQLEVYKKLQQEHPLDVVITYMGAHAIPPRYKNKTDEYVDEIIQSGLQMARAYATFCDIFTEKDVFELEDSKRLLLAAKEMGYKLKMHADEIEPLGGAELAAEVGCVSADHLLKISDQGIEALKKSGTIATVLPLTAFSLKEEYAPARKMIDQGLAVALASDLNPGSSYSNSTGLIIALSTIYMGLSIEETITAMTLNAAAALDLANKIGSIDVGKKADLLLFDLPNYKHLSYHFGVNQLQSVIKEGKLIYDRGQTC